MEQIFESPLPLLLSAVIGYLFGSIPFGLILTKMAGYGDIRTIGSGNIGATNVLRTGNKKLAIATLLLDALKGAVAILTIKFIFPIQNILLTTTFYDCPKFPCATPTSAISDPIYIYLPFIAALFALLGHIFPVWLKFKGGKGVATGLGILLALSWLIGLAAAGTWLVTAVVTRISSLSALVAILLTPVFAYVFSGDLKFTALCLVMAVIITIKHRANITRLLGGTEPKIGAKKE